MSTMKLDRFWCSIRVKKENMVFICHELNEIKFLSHSFDLQSQDIFQARKDQKKDHLKMNFDIFQILKKYQTEQQ